MKSVLRIVTLIGLFVSASMPVFASPAGVWELETRDTRFRLELCGDGTQLCGELVWLSDADYNEQYKPYLNAPMAYQIRQVSPSGWKGDMRLFGHKLAGTITQVNENQMTLTGCAFLVACKTYQMFRYSK